MKTWNEWIFVFYTFLIDHVSKIVAGTVLTGYVNWFLFSMKINVNRRWKQIMAKCPCFLKRKVQNRGFVIFNVFFSLKQIWKSLASAIKVPSNQNIIFFLVNIRSLLSILPLYGDHCLPCFVLAYIWRYFSLGLVVLRCPLQIPNKNQKSPNPIR